MQMEWAEKKNMIEIAKEEERNEADRVAAKDIEAKMHKKQ